VILLFLVSRSGWSAENAHRPVGEHYHLPMVSFRSALMPEIEAKRVGWNDLLIDEVHPSDLGHELAASFVIELLRLAWRAEPRPGHAPAKHALPSPLVSDRFQHATLRGARELRAPHSSGWVLDARARAWVSHAPGSVIELEVDGEAPLLMEWRARSSTSTARVSVDGGKAEVFHDPYAGAPWNGWPAVAPLATAPGRARHRVRIEMVEDAAPRTAEREVRILGLGWVGAPRLEREQAR
jgi:hypothetical protein